MDLAKEHGLIDSLYDTAMGDESWDQIGHWMRDYLDGKALMLSTHDPAHSSTDIVLTQGLIPAAPGVRPFRRPRTVGPGCPSSAASSAKR